MDFVVHPYPVVGSTNDELRSLWKQGATEGAVAWAERQTAGRGRRGRSWVSEPGNLYASVLLTPGCPLSQVSQMSFVMAVAVGEAILPFLPSPEFLSYKWPNDVLFQGAKMAGILIETEPGGNGLAEACIVGTGVNIACVPNHLPYPVTALNNHTEIPLTPGDVLPGLLNQIGKYYALWRQEGFAPIRDLWKHRAYGLGKLTTIKVGDNNLRGEFVDINAEGAFLLKEEGGRIQAVISAEVF